MKNKNHYETVVQVQKVEILSRSAYDRSQYGILWSMSGHLTSSEKMSMEKTMKIKKCKKMPLSLASSSDVARILAMTHKDTIDL